MPLAFVGCKRKIHVSVRNDSGRPLEKVDILAQGERFPLGTLAPGEEKSTAFLPQKDSTVAVRFVSPPEKKPTFADLTYFERSFFGRVGVRVDRQMKVHAKNALRIGY